MQSLLAHFEVTITQEKASFLLFSSFSRIDYKNNLLMSFTSQRTGIEIVKMTT